MHRLRKNYVIAQSGFASIKMASFDTVSMFHLQKQLTIER